MAIDGPAGAGKSTVARRLANQLGYVLVDTGAMYRAVALLSQRSGVAWGDATAVSSLARSLVSRGALFFERDEEGGVRTLVSGEDISEAIRTQPIAQGASLVSAHAGVRAALVDLQRQAGAHGGVVLEGRDIATVIFPDAEAKFFLTASAETRARRRYAELVAKGHAATLEETLADLTLRDSQDEGRAVAPLRCAPGAMVVDSTDLTLDETVERMLTTVRALSVPRTPRTPPSPAT